MGEASVCAPFARVRTQIESPGNSEDFKRESTSTVVHSRVATDRLLQFEVGRNRQASDVVPAPHDPISDSGPDEHRAASKEMKPREGDE